MPTTTTTDNGQNQKSPLSLSLRNKYNAIHISQIYLKPRDSCIQEQKKVFCLGIQAIRFPTVNKLMIANNINLVFLQQFIKRRFFYLLYIRYIKRVFILTTGSKMFLRNRSLFSIQLCRNLICMILILRFQLKKMVKEVASLASIFNKHIRSKIS